MFGNKNFYEQWADYQKKFFESFSGIPESKEPMGVFFPKLDFIDPLFKLKDTGNIYKEMFDFFNRFNNVFLNPDKSSDLDSFNKYFKKFQETYVNQIKSSLGLVFPSTPEDFFNKFSSGFGINLFETGFFKPLTDYMKKFSVTGDNFFEMLNSNEEFKRFLNSPSMGLTREFVEIIKEVIKNYIEYVKQLKTFEKEVSEKGKESFEKFVEEIMNAVKKGENLEDFDKVFKKWININESVFQEYFRSKEFVAFLSEYTKTSAKLKSSIDEYTFAVLKDSNIATKTELDRAYKDIYNLKKEVRELKKILKQKEDK